MDGATQNATFNGTDADLERSLYDHLNLGLLICTTLVGIVCNVIIIYLMAMMRKVQNRTYMLILHWSIQDLFLDLLVLLSGMVIWFPQFSTLVCVDFHLEPILIFNATLIMAILNCNTLMKSSFKWDKILCGCVYGIVLSMGVLSIVLCKLGVRFFAIYSVPFLMHVVALITLIVKEINKCWKRRTDPLSEETAFRMNLARIYIYNWTIFYAAAILIGMFTEIRAGFLLAFGFLSSSFVLVYLIIADEEFKKILLKTFRKTKEYDVDTTHNFAEDDNNIGNA